jgi:hypothetical protein
MKTQMENKKRNSSLSSLAKGSTSSAEALYKETMRRS